jgi:hypothetical protein
MTPRGRILNSLAWLLIAAAASADAFPASGQITAVSSRVFNGYTRILLPDGSPKPERYGFQIGGVLNTSPRGMEVSTAVATSDATIDAISFSSIEKMIEGPLSMRKYMPDPDPATADLLIVVFWGRTIGTSAFQGSDISQTVLASDQDKIDEMNARLLGFDSERVLTRSFGRSIQANILREVHSDVLDAVKEDRYYVILQAFDFQAAWKRKDVRLLWETRFSISQRGHDFGKDLPRMAMAASQYFGQDTHGIVNRPIPEGQVNIGDVKSLGEVPQK